MKCAEDFRAIARDALRGRWLVAVLTGFVASLLGAGIANSGSSISDIESRSDTIRNLQGTELWLQIRGFVFAAILVLALWVIVTLIIGGAVKLGYAVFNLKLVDQKDVAFSDLFSQSNRLGAGFCMNFLTGLYTLLWSLLFIIPGIIKMYSYAMTPYILAEHPGMTATESITQSKQMMEGNKWRLFCLEFSFIGWALLCSVPTLIALGIVSGMAIRSGSVAALLWMIPAGIPAFVGSLFLNAYEEAARAAFYREVSGAERV